MAPTEILAEQHLLTLGGLLAPLGVARGAPDQRREGQGADGAARRRRGAAPSRCVVGTHALVQEGVRFRRLGLAVVDEQHRFGVAQRATLRGKGESPDVLVMTATPIPRTLALTLYGDLDVSVLDELPPGRKPVVTVARGEPKRARRSTTSCASRSAAGRQVYVVCPLVEESEAIDLRAATEMAERLQREVFADLRVGLLHGRMSFADKERVMREFKDGALHILVSTTVIEVGIDVPNASVMLIEHAERFGLSQLHQLRGRVGRGPWKSYCILLTGARVGGRAAPHRRHDRDQRRLPHRRGRSRRCAAPAISSAPASRGCPSSASPISCATAPCSRRRGADAVALVQRDPQLLDARASRAARGAARALARQARPRGRSARAACACSPATLEGPAPHHARGARRRDRRRTGAHRLPRHAHALSAEAAPFLDLFAGAGGVGIEALSRGAPSAVFVEQDALAAARAARQPRAPRPRRPRARGPRRRRARAVDELGRREARASPSSSSIRRTTRRAPRPRSPRSRAAPRCVAGRGGRAPARDARRRRPTPPGVLALWPRAAVRRDHLDFLSRRRVD